MCSANLLALAIKVYRNLKTDKKSDQDFYIDWAWHKWINCLSLKRKEKKLRRLKLNSYETDCHWMAIVGKNSALNEMTHHSKKIAKRIWIAYAWDQISAIEKCHSIDLENFLTQNILEFCIEIDCNIQKVW